MSVMVCGLFTLKEAKILVKTMKKSIESCDFGAEVVSRLLNDKRSLFKTLLAKCSDEVLATDIFDAVMIRKSCPRAGFVADGLVKFFQKVLELIENGYGQNENSLKKIARKNGAMHYRIKVYFQAENWLCVKRCVIDLVLVINPQTKNIVKDISEDFKKCCARNICGVRAYSSDSFNECKRRTIAENIEHVWAKLMKFIVYNMKQGFLEAALEQGEQFL